MTIEHTDRKTLWLCNDCTLAHCNGESPDDDARSEEVDSGHRRLAALGHISDDSGRDDDDNDGYRDLTAAPCDCCRTRLAGERYRFAHWVVPQPPPGVTVDVYRSAEGPRVTVATAWPHAPALRELRLTPGDAEALARALLHAAAKAGRL